MSDQKILTLQDGVKMDYFWSLRKLKCLLGLLDFLRLLGELKGVFERMFRFTGIRRVLKRVRVMIGRFLAYVEILG